MTRENSQITSRGRPWWRARQNKDWHLALLNPRKTQPKPTVMLTNVFSAGRGRLGPTLQRQWTQIAKRCVTDMWKRALWTVRPWSPLRPLTVSWGFLEMIMAYVVLTLRTWKSLASLHRSQNLGSNRCSTVSLLNMVTTLHIICWKKYTQFDGSEVSSVYIHQQAKPLQISIWITTFTCKQLESMTKNWFIWQILFQQYLQ